jgi:hypothetical protein
LEVDFFVTAIMTSLTDDAELVRAGVNLTDQRVANHAAIAAGCATTALQTCRAGSTCGDASHRSVCLVAFPATSAGAFRIRHCASLQ